jgi:hypothetical protein
LPARRLGGFSEQAGILYRHGGLIANGFEELQQVRIRAQGGLQEALQHPHGTPADPHGSAHDRLAVGLLRQ